MFPSDSSCPMVLWILLAHFGFRLRGSHSLRLGFPSHSTNFHDTRYSPNPNRIATIGLASSAFARHYSRNLGWFLFLRVLRCFSSPGSLRITMDSWYVTWFFTMWVSPFGNLWIEAYLQLPTADRSLSRPSSAPDAKAFTLRSCSLELLVYFLYLVLFELSEFLAELSLSRTFVQDYIDSCRCEKAFFSPFALLLEFVSTLRWNCIFPFVWKD